MKFVIAGICSVGRSSDHRDRERRDSSKLQKRAEIIARREQHPDRQDRRRQPVNHDRPGQPFLVVPKPGFDRGIMRQELPAPNAEGQAEPIRRW